MTARDREGDARAMVELAKAALAAATRKQYDRVARDYEKVMRKRGVKAWPASSESLAAFIRELVERQQRAADEGKPPVSTVRQAMSAIHAVHRLSGWSWPWTPLLSAAALGAEKLANERRASDPATRAAKLDNRRLPFDVRAAQSAVQWFEVNAERLTHDKRQLWTCYLAIVFVGLRLMLRGASLCLLNVGDVRFRGDGVHVFLARSKTDRVGAGAWQVMERREDATAPAERLQRWLRERAAIANIDSESTDAMFVWPVKERGRSGAIKHWRRVTTADVTKAVREVYRAAGKSEADVARVSAHSLRAGGATRLYELGAPEYVVRATAGWASSQSMEPYVAMARSMHAAEMFLPE